MYRCSLLARHTASLGQYDIVSNSAGRCPGKSTNYGRLKDAQRHLRMARVAGIHCRSVVGAMGDQGLDVERAVALPNLVKSGSFTLRRRVQPARKGHRQSLPKLEEGCSEFQAFLMDKGKVKRSKKEAMERGLVRQHRDVWAGIIRRDRLTEEGLGGGSGVLVGRLLASMQEEDKARPLLEGMAGQAEQTRVYMGALRSAVLELRETGRTRSGELGGRKAKARLESLRRLVEAGLAELAAEQAGLEDELDKVGELAERVEQEEEPEEEEQRDCSPDCSSSPDLLSSDSGFRTDDVDDATLHGSSENSERCGRMFERFDICWEAGADTIVGLVEEAAEVEVEEACLVQPTAGSGGVTSAMVELEKYFLQPRRYVETQSVSGTS